MVVKIRLVKDDYNPMLHVYQSSTNLSFTLKELKEYDPTLNNYNSFEYQSDRYEYTNIDAIAIFKYVKQGRIGTINSKDNPNIHITPKMLIEVAKRVHNYQALYNELLKCGSRGDQRINYKHFVNPLIK